MPDPTYHAIGDHTEVFQVDFDPAVVSYEELLELAMASHDPFRAAFKEQYASLVLTHSPEQLVTAHAVAERFESARGARLATRIEPLGTYTNAEEYHQKYYLRNDRVLMAEFRAMFGADGVAFRESTSAARVNGYVAGDAGGAQLAREIDLLGLSEEGRARLRAKAGRGRFGAGCSI